MPEFFPGDVVLAPVRFGGNSGVKTRPAVVLGSEGVFVKICPVTSHLPRDCPLVALDLDDFEKGGLSLFDESYILVNNITKIRKNEVVGKKGRLTPEKVSCISSMITLR
ncbi:mRNA-degrading endonuclease toxin of MazEF toxin-antitoxin module [Methanomicrobium sp. W14]|uniref:type II toxin-antitoxin system PemK/MazF family toxin n=1 Tax=Methanomicrobium sp. W14 TaxID=2817839 RepID=UPI001AEA030E|nr:type II toxin-antitoxin system PemK/MazF family toxin [Methanomicrobium sp. W14]MBP2133742.1 mRNA-degrading endonuclease toxin of MazEF toxin-antitoxin module [Methanomicrobium sp. W14]